jgi:hypothetical protein
MSQASPAGPLGIGLVPRQRLAAAPPPIPLTTLLGREDEIARLVDLLDQPTNRLITLCGPGGIGKTRLAIEVATRLAAEFAHGAAFVSLASVRQPALVVASIAWELGLPEQDDQPIEDVVLAALRDTHLLLVLDNVEHVVDGVAPWLTKILAACPLVTVLATSRLPLRISGEQRYTVPPLPLSEAGAATMPSGKPFASTTVDRLRPGLPRSTFGNSVSSTTRMPSVAHGVGIPDVAVQDPLDPAGMSIPGLLRQLPAILALNVGQQPAHGGGGVIARFPPPEVAVQAIGDLINRCRNP